MDAKENLQEEANIPVRAVIGSGLILGLAHLFGPLPVACITLFIAAGVMIVLFKKSFHSLVLAGILMLSCVFIEPAPSDLMFCSLIFLGLFTGRYKPRLQGRSVAPILIFLAYFIVSLPGIAISSDQSAALRYYSISFYLFLLTVFICTYATRDNITSILRAYTLAAFFSFLAGLAGYLGLFPDLLMADPFRVKGLFKDPNVFGPFFVPAIILLVDDIIRRAILKIHPMIHVAVITMLSLGVIFSFSRAAWINLSLSLSVYFVLNFKAFRLAKQAPLIVAVLVILAIALGLFLSPLMSDTGIGDFLQERAKIQDYDNNRFNGQLGGLRLIGQNPFGYGPGQFENEIVQITKYELAAHSLYIRTAVENGILGFLLFFTALIFMLLLLLGDHRKAQKAGREQALAKSVGLPPAVPIAIICGILVNSLVVDTIHWRHFWFFIGLGLYYLKEVREEWMDYD